MRAHFPALALITMALGAAEPVYDTRELVQYPWEPTFPRDATREPLTAADWVGPDGIIYPYVAWAGVHTGEPGQRTPGIPERTDIHTTLSADLAGPGQGAAFTSALQAAVVAAGEAGGGVVVIPAGTFELIRPLVVRHANVVVRGAGRGTAVEAGGRNDAQETRLRFTFTAGDPDSEPVRVLAYPEPDRLIRDGLLSVYAQPFHARSSWAARQQGGKNSHIHGFYLTITPEGGTPFTVAASRDGKDRERVDIHQGFGVGGPTCATGFAVESLRERLRGATRATIVPRVVWRWQEEAQGKRTPQEQEAVGAAFTVSWDDLESHWPDGQRAVLRHANTSAMLFQGDTQTLNHRRAPLLTDAKRGDTRLHIDCADLTAAEAIGLRPGAMMQISAYVSQSFADAIERDDNQGVPRDQVASVLMVEPHPEHGVIVVMEQPLHLDFPVNEGNVEQWDQQVRGYVRNGTKSSWVSARLPITDCGVEDLALEQVGSLWLNGITMSTAMNCWVRNVRVERAGRDPISVGGLFTEIRDCELIDPRYANNTGGGSAYLHGSSLGLVSNVYARNCRHAPNFSGHTAGVFHNSRFFSSDMQWHQNWGRAHVFDGCTVDALGGTGSYSYGAFAQRSIADIHGPGMGPRNVIYGCDLIGPKGGIFLGGKSENPIIVYNRVRAWSGPGLILRYHIFNGVFMGNHLAVMNRFEPGVLFGDPDPKQSRLARPKGGTNPPMHPGLGGANPGNDFLANVVYGGNGRLADGSWRFEHVRSPWRRSFGNRVEPWTAEPPKPQLPMPSLFLAQRANPAGFRDRLTHAAFLHADRLPADREGHADGDLVARINFRDRRGEHADNPQHWHGEDPSTWLADLGEPFPDAPGATDTLVYGWTGGTPTIRQESHWSDDDFRYRTTAIWGGFPNDDLRPFAMWERDRDLTWQIALEPGRYRILLAAGSPRRPERFSWPDEQPQPYEQINDFLLNDVLLKDPGQSDKRRDFFRAEVTVGDDRLLCLRPAPTAITPQIAFIEIYRLP